MTFPKVDCGEEKQGELSHLNLFPWVTGNRLLILHSFKKYYLISDWLPYGHKCSLDDLLDAGTALIWRRDLISMRWAGAGEIGSSSHQLYLWNETSFLVILVNVFYLSLAQLMDKQFGISGELQNFTVFKWCFYINPFALQMTIFPPWRLTVVAMWLTLNILVLEVLRERGI